MMVDLEALIERARTQRLEAGQLVETAWRRYARSAASDTPERTTNYREASLADDLYRRADRELCALLRQKHDLPTEQLEVAA